MHARVLHQADYRRMRWKNGGGWTTQLAVSPQSATSSGAPIDWRISIAEIESDGAFSTFPGCERYIALLEGVGMLLEFDQAPTVELRERLRFVRFDGDWQTNGRLLSGPVRDFNVIARRDAVAATVLHRPLVGPMVFLPEEATWFVHVAGGTAQVRIDGTAQTLDAGDSLIIVADATTERVVLDGGGELVLVKFTTQPNFHRPLNPSDRPG